ncbi:MAG: hypothetical protein ACLR5Q_12150 [Coprococcus sp.]
MKMEAISMMFCIFIMQFRFPTKTFQVHSRSLYILQIATSGEDTASVTVPVLFEEKEIERTMLLIRRASRITVTSPIQL